jgi:hypothetical protein
MLTQQHHFITDDEVHIFERVFFRFLSQMEDDLQQRDESLFWSHEKSVRRQTVTVQSTSPGLLAAFNLFLTDHKSRTREPETV